MTNEQIAEIESKRAAWFAWLAAIPREANDAGAIEGLNSACITLLDEVRAMLRRRVVHIAFPRSEEKMGAMCGDTMPAMLARDLPAAVGYEGTVCPGCLKENSER